jgi:SAM-dependent methyltransferase
MASDALKRAPEMLAPIAVTYDLRIRQCGIDPRGVYWKTVEGQKLRFEILLGIIDARFDEEGTVQINDLGCGYGALFDLMQDMPCMRKGRYFGYDISEEMIKTCRRRIQDPRATFEQTLIATKQADYSLVSGTYNMRMDVDIKFWRDYIKESLVQLWRSTRRGLAFNLLSTHDKQKVSGLYYSDPAEYLDFCLRNLSDNVAIMHDYPLKEFTIYVHR